jgi:hypothetical protein
MNECDSVTEHLQSNVLLCKNNPELFNCVLSAPSKSNLPDTLVFNPEPKSVFNCPECFKQLIQSGRFCDNTIKRKPPRLLFATSRNVMLVSRILICPTKNCGEWLSHHRSILKQCKIEYEFLLYHDSGITKELLLLIINSLIEGKRYPNSKQMATDHHF